MTATDINVTIGRHLHTALGVATSINRAIDQGKTVTVNGRTVKRQFSTVPAASGWSNGSLSVDVEPRTRGARVGTVWAKVGDTVTLTVTVPA